jgi:hypothetical protein
MQIMDFFGHASAWTSNSNTNIWTVPAQGVSERLARRARSQAHQQPDVARAALDVAHATGRFPRESHVQHPINFSNIQKKTDETLETSV